MTAFQSTRPRGARPVQSRTAATELRFNPRAHVGRDYLQGNPHRPGASFNPRAHVGRDLAKYWTRARLRRFNPRAHVGRDVLPRLLGQGVEQVSIHAPTWGATDGIIDRLQRFLVSIHAPTWGATKTAEPALRLLDVSIHAPTWGATDHLMDQIEDIFSFNPRAHVGRDRGRGQHRWRKRRFQSTRPRGARLALPIT